MRQLGEQWVEEEKKKEPNNTVYGYNSKCPVCGGELDTGFRCTKCGKQFFLKQEDSITCVR